MVETRNVELSSKDLLNKLEAFKYSSDLNIQVDGNKPNSDIFKFEIYSKSYQNDICYKNNDPSSELSFESIAKELLVKENKVLKLRCDKLSVQNKSLDQQLDNFRTKCETQEAQIKSLQSSNSVLKGSDDKSIYIDKRIISLKSDLQLYIDVVNNIKNQHQSPNELEVAFNDSVKNIAILEDNLLAEKKKTDELLVAKFLLISDVAALKSTELQLQSKVDIQESRIHDLDINVEGLKSTIAFLREELESERKEKSLLQDKLSTVGEAVEAGREALMLCMAAEEALKKSFTVEVNNLKAMIQSLQIQATNASQNFVTVGFQATASSNCHGSQSQAPSVPAVQQPMPLTKDITTHPKESTIRAVANNKRPQQNCPACGEIAYGLMVKCHECDTEHHSICSRKIKRGQRSADGSEAVGPFLCTPCSSAKQA